ncbi:tail fiber domain-containing protein [Bacillus cereus group sp. Bc015]|uniref:tail fiber domain-containing protein n=1 Tax=Bacillus cereus group sp. Bc015 TaxID=3018123 RepID=UPI0022E3BF0B|nr:tail fiber domain-containing protein [Bacillus cereus group sp. Bc015]MDA2738371.1 tail fiber domain-containing protein [Bacillus cereus group sp. Bc015]
MSVIAQGQITLYEVWDGAKGDKGDQGIQGVQGVQGERGADGTTYYTWIKYADTPTSGMSDYPTGKAYMGIAYNKTTPVESTNYNDYAWSLIKGEKGDQGERGLQGLQGEKGDQGIQGVAGKDGLSSYTHIAYATNSTGTAGFSISDPVGKTYIGIYVDHTPTDSTDPTKYKWTLIKGQKGDQGIQGQAGADGKTPYFHIAYANNSTGTIGFSTTDATGRTYIGTYTDYTSADSTDPSKYTWALIKGEKGDKGDQGIQGEKGKDGIQYYTWLKYADSPTTGMSDDPTGKAYIGLAYNKTTPTESTNYADYQWSLIKGEKGDQGVQGLKGADGVTTYTWIKYATSSTGAGMSDDPTGKTYIGLAYNKTTPTESTNPLDYKWSLIKGDKGDKGDQGVQGIQGVPGKDGKTYYTWIKYANDSAGTGMSDLPDGKPYIGIAYNKLTATESTNPADYSWSKIQGEKGETGLQGVKGADGKTYYTWIKYADTPTSGMSDSPTGKKYMGIAYNKLTATESTNYADYSWSLIKGDKGDKGDQGIQGIPGVAGKDGVTTYTWVKYADDELGNGMSDYPEGKRYLGLAYNKTTPTESTNKADYSWSPLYDNVEVGGRNIMTGTSFEDITGWDKWGSIGRVISYKIDVAGKTPCLATETRDSAGKQLPAPVGTAIGLQSVGHKFPVKKGQQYTVSFKVATSELGDTLDYTYVMYTVTGGNRQQPTIRVKDFPVENPIYSGATTFYHHVSFTFTADRDDDNVYLLIGGKTVREMTGSNGYAWIRIRELMVEKGNVHSAWQEAPEDVQADIDSALGSIADMSSDSKITAVEKHTLKKEWDTIVAEKPTLEAQATTYGITTEKTNFTNAYNTLNTFITPLLSNINTTSSADGNTLRTNFKNYYNTKALLQKKITDVAKGSIDSKANTTVVTPIKNAVEGWTIGQINGKPAMNGEMIQKDTVLANRLAVGSFENLFTNGSGEYGAIGWDAHPQWSVVNDSATAYSGSYYFKGLHGSTSASDFYDSNVIQVRAGEKYYLEGYFRLANSGTAFNTRTFLVKWTDKAGKVSWSTFTGNLTSSWKKLAYEVTVPATAVKMQIGISVASGLASGNSTYADSLFCKKKLTGELIVDGAIKANNIDVANLMSQTAVINTIKSTDISGDRVKGGKISGVTYESINASNPKIKVVIEGNTIKSYGASDGTKQNYAEMKEGGLSVFQMAETGSPFGDLKAYVEPARFNAVQGSRSSAFEPSELRFWVPNMTGRLSFDVVGEAGGTGYGLRLEAPGGVVIKNTSGNAQLQFDNTQAIYFDNYGNIHGGLHSTSGATWSIKDGDGRIRFLTGIGKGATQTTEYNAYVGGHAFNHNGTRAVAIFRRGDDTFLQLGTEFSFQWNNVAWRTEAKTADGNGWRNMAANAFQNVSSLTYKTDIQNYEESVLDVIMNTDIMTYKYKTDVEERSETAPTHIGVISEYAPKIITNEDSSAVDLYAMVSVSWKAIQELYQQIQELKAEINLLKAPVQEANN